LTIVGTIDGDGRMSMFLDIVAALLAWGMAAAWVLTGGEKLPPDLDPTTDRQRRQGWLT
jgi:hypothetical protein